MIEIPNLPYSIDSLKPMLSTEVVDYHYNILTKKYYDNVNKLITNTMYSDMTIEEIADHPKLAGTSSKLGNNARQALNHTIYWDNMKSSNSKLENNALLILVKNQFESEDKLKDQFIKVGMDHFGSGWVWLTYKNDQLAILSTHDSLKPSSKDNTLLLVCDLWEHAWYPQYLTDRKQYLTNFWKLINWDIVSNRYDKRAS
jgi:superoxide dismutase, Fe-Mn family